MAKKAASRKTDELDEANSRIEDLETRVEQLEGELAQLEVDGEVEDRGAEFMRDQLDTLAVEVDSSSAPSTHDQWRRCLNGIRRGDDWRHGTWK